MSLIFCEKYKPIKSNDIIGDAQSTYEITQWIKSFQKQNCKCLLITGSHGCGKTCRVEIILKELDYTKKHLNILKFKKSEDQSSYIRELTCRSDILSLFRGQSSKRCAIVIDELDPELLNQEKNQLINLMKLNNNEGLCPIIFVFDVRHNKIVNTLKKGTYNVRIAEPTEEDMMNLLKKICYYEKIKIQNENVAKKIIAFSQNDFRKLCVTLYDLRNDMPNKMINQIDIEKYKEVVFNKDIPMDLFRSTNSLLTHYQSVDECMRSYEIEKVNLPLMIHQNYLSTLDDEKSDFSYLRNVTKSLSKGDVIDNYIYGEQRWDIANVHGLYSCCFPSYFLKNKKLHKKISYFVDMNRASVGKLNKKHIINAARTFDSVDPFDYIYINKLITSLILANNMEELSKIMKYYKLTLEDIEAILKIDKNNQSKITLTSKQKKILKEL